MSSFKEKYFRLREKFDKVSAIQRQYTKDLHVAKSKTRRLKEENKPTSDSDTTMDDLSDSDDDSDHAPVTHMEGDRKSIPDRARQMPPTRPQVQGQSSLSGVQYNTMSTPANINSFANTPTSTPAPMPTPMFTPTNNIASTSTPSYNTEVPPSAPEEIHVPKQTRKATKRADRGRPRAVVPLITNPDGTLNYPIVVGKGTNEVIIENMGRIVWQGRGYHNHRYIFPVGFRSKKQYTSLSDTSKKTYFISEILDGGDAPIFQISLEDMPEKVFRHSSSSGAWELALKSLMDLGFNAKTHASGPDMYGLTNLGVIKYIQEMPNAHRCRRYMPLKWIIDQEHVDGIPLSELQAQQSAGESSQSASVAGAGSKSPNKKKKINNTIYASNHSSVQKEYEATRGSSAEYTLASKPYTPRKYTKRKQQTTPTPSPVQSLPLPSFSMSLAPVLSTSGQMDGTQPTRWPLSPPMSTSTATSSHPTNSVLGAPVHLDDSSGQNKDGPQQYRYQPMEP
ncbi:transforming growth factor beta regulator 1 [Podila clonocystis]|nr:transforming growth factor beta regulator 1 [Podila clonocystis]